MSDDAIDQITEWFMAEYIKMLAPRPPNHIVTMADGHIDIDLPIDSIDGVGLENVYIRLYKKSLDLNIILNNCEYSNGIYNWGANRCMVAISLKNSFGNDNLELCFTKYNIREGIEAVFKKMENLKYNNFGGYFMDTPLPTPLPVKAISTLCSLGLAKSSKPLSECCVCYEITKTHFTQCKHVVCGRCISNIKQTHLNCPLCRVCIDEE